MLPPRRSPTAAATLARVDELAAKLRREAEQAEPDPFDEAMVAAVEGLAKVMRSHAEAMDDLHARMRLLARRASR